MSGRLIILPHKSWNVWNRDNVEKVQRDERLHSEELQKQHEQQRVVAQETVLTKLKKRRRGEDHVEEQGDYDQRKQQEDEVPQEQQVEVYQPDGHINFFAEAEKQHKELAKNKEYELEKQAQELLEKRRNGVAPWALGEGAFEHKKLKPWYEQQGSDMPAAMKEKEDRRKTTHDPMAHLLQPRQLDDDDVEQPKTEWIVGKSSALAMAVGSFINRSSDIDDAREQALAKADRSKSGKKHKKKDNKDNKEKKRVKTKHSRSRATSRDSPSQKDIRRSSKDSSSLHQDEIALLRKRRLEREQREGKRTATLLAEAQMGSPVPQQLARRR